MPGLEEGSALAGDMQEVVLPLLARHKAADVRHTLAGQDRDARRMTLALAQVRCACMGGGACLH